MSGQNQLPNVCKNGHQQPVSNTRFCIYCGLELNVQNPRSNQISGNPKNEFQPYQNHLTEPVPLNGNSNLSNQAFPPSNFDLNLPLATYQQPYIQPQQGIQISSNDGTICYHCGGNGQKFDLRTMFCEECNWLRPLVPGYQVDPASFEWAADGKAMQALRSMSALNSLAQSVSEKMGRRWVESSFNGILLSEKQLPEIYKQAVKGARILGLSHMPDIYVSGDRSWDCMTYGSEKDSFIIIGSALAGNFQGDDLLFLIAREMGHCRAGHALWKTVIKFLVGEQNHGKSAMAGGFINLITRPMSMVENALEMPLLAWARQSEITADRAGLLAVGSEEVARRVLLSWTLKSSIISRQINVEAWLEQQADASNNEYSRLAEMSSSTTPYIVPRLKILADFAKSNELQNWRKMISYAVNSAYPPENPAPKTAPQPAISNNSTKTAAMPEEIMKIKCGACQTAMQFPLKIFAGKTELSLKCPNSECGKITVLKKNVKPIEKAKTADNLKQDEENLNYGD